MLVAIEPPPGINSDDTTFSAEGRWANGDGFRFYLGKAETIGGHHSVTATNMASSASKALVYTVSGVVRIAVAGTTKLTTMTTAGSVTNITPSAGQAWNTNSPTQFSLKMWGDDLLASPNGGTIYTSSLGATATEIATAPDRITCMLVTGTRQVMALGCNEAVSGTFNGRCIRISDTEDNTDWTPTSANLSDEVILPGQETIVGGAMLGTYALVWTQGSLWLGEFTGNFSQPWAFNRVGEAGLIGMDAFAILEQTVFWVAPDMTIRSYTAGGLILGVPCPVSREFINGCEIARRSQISACAIRRFGEVWFWYPTAVGAADGGAQCIAYSEHESIAAQRPVWFIVTRGMIGLQENVGAMVESSLLAPAFATQGSTTIIIPRTTAAFLAVDCSITPVGPIDATFITSADHYIDNSKRRMMIRSFIPDFEALALAANLNVSTRSYPGGSPNSSDYAISAGATKKDFRKSGKIVAFSISNEADAANRIRLGKPLFDVVPTGER